MKKKKEVVDRWLRMYKGFTIEEAATREGSLDILKNPSRMGNLLYYPNGEVRDARVNGNDQTDHQ